MLQVPHSDKSKRPQDRSHGGGACMVCGKPFSPKRRGRPQRFCSDRCRLEAFRASRNGLTETKIGEQANIPDDPKNGNFSSKLDNENNGLQGPKNDLEKANLHWLKVNEVTWKLTDGETIRTPASHGQWAGFNSSRAIAWVIDCGWPIAGHAAWYARYNNKSFGPATVNKAKAAALALIAGEPVEENEAGARTFHGRINLHRAALTEPSALPAPAATTDRR